MANHSKYQRKYAEMLIEHMKHGNSFEAFGAVVRVTEETLNNWCKKHPEFGIAKELGKRYEQKYWEDLLKMGATGQMPPIRKKMTILGPDGKVKQQTIIDEPSKFNATSVIFALKCKFPKIWRDKQEIEITSKDSLDHLTDEEIKRRKDLYASIISNKEQK